MSIKEETLKTILSGVAHGTFVGGKGMSFDEALIRMRQGQVVTRAKWNGKAKFSIGVDEDYDHQFPCLLKHVKVSKTDEDERWRAYIVSHVSIHDLFAEDWEVCDGPAV